MSLDISATTTPCILPNKQKKRRSVLALNTSFNVSILGEIEGPESVAQAVMSPLSTHPKGVANIVNDSNAADQPSNKTSRRSLRADDLLSGKHTPSKDQVITRPNMNDEQLLDHYQTCIQLVSKGKVSAKNAFSLHLIDVMSDVLSSCNKDTFFQTAGCTLDAGAKIYSFRVDNLHSDAYRVANVLGSNKREEDEHDQGNMDVEAGMEGAGGKMDEEIPAALKKKRKRNFKCIVSDLSKIQKRVNYNVGHDALYQKASMVIGNTRPTDLLSLHMPVTDCDRREKIVVDGSTKVSFPSQNLQGSHFAMILKSVLNLPDPEALSQISLCQSVDKIMQMLDVTLTGNENDEDVNENDFDSSSMDRFLDDVNANFAHDADAPPVPEDEMYVDCDAGDVYDDALRPEIADKTFGVGPPGVLSGTEYDIGNESNFNILEPSLPNLLKHVGPGEFSNFSEHVLEAFFGRKKVKARGEKQPTKKKTSPENVVVQYVQDFVQASTKNKALTILSEPKGDKKKKTCAAYSRVEYNRSKWTSYFELDLDFIKNNSMPDPENLDLQETYNYNNPLDVSNARLAPTANNEGDYADDFGNNFNDDDDDEMPNAINPDADLDDDALPGTNDNLCDMNLIEAPIYAEQFKINYAKRAKNVDVRKVKRSMLNYLKDHDTEPEVSKLTSIFRNARRTLKPVDVRDLSLHVAFVTLLDLANEQKLQLHNNNDFTEVLVKLAASQ